MVGNKSKWVFWDAWKWYEIQISMSINKALLNMATPICLSTIGLCAPTAELSSWIRWCELQSWKYLSGLWRRKRLADYFSKCWWKEFIFPLLFIGLSWSLPSFRPFIPRGVWSQVLEPSAEAGLVGDTPMDKQLLSSNCLNLESHPRQTLTFHCT